MQLDDARDELKAVRFFFELLCKEQEKEPPDNFRYLLKPFLNGMYTLQNRVLVEVTPYLRKQKARRGRKTTKDYFKSLCDKWVATLSLEEQTLWTSMEKLRHSDVHTEPVGTVRKDKVVPRPVGDSTGATERSWAFAAQYIDVSQAHGPAYYVPARKQSFPFSRLDQVTIKVHHFTGPEQREVVKACKSTVVLLERFIDHFEIALI